MMKKPYLIKFPKIGNSELGYISVSEKNNLPFIPKRLYWTYFTPENVVRGHHAHFELEQILISVSGIIELELENIDGDKFNFKLDRPYHGVYIPKMCWRKMIYSHNSVQLCIASIEFDEDDYIRDYSLFKEFKLKNNNSIIK